MSLAKLTMIGFNTYLYQNDHQTLFDKMILPTGLDKDLVVDNIMLQGGEFECIYSNPYFMRDAVEVWSKKWYRTFDKWVAALNIEYNPLENYDRFEHWNETDHRGESTSSTHNSGNTTTYNNQDKRTLDTNDLQTLNTADTQTLNTQNQRTLDTHDNRTINTQEQRTLATNDNRTLNTQEQRTLNTQTVIEEEVSAFDSSTYQPSSKNTTGNTGTDTMNNTGTDNLAHTGTDTMNNTGTDNLAHTGTDTLNNTGTDTTAHTGTDNVAHTGTDTMDHSGTVSDALHEGTSGQTTENGSSDHDGRVHGNIGIRSSQELLTQELEVQKFNLVEQITDLFLQEFCILVYE